MLFRAFDIGEKLGFRCGSLFRIEDNDGGGGGGGGARGEQSEVVSRMAGVSILISEICLKRGARRRGKYRACFPLRSNFIQSTIAFT